MRWIASAIIIAAIGLLFGGPVKEYPCTLPGHAEAAANYLCGLPWHDRIYTRFLTWCAVPQAKLMQSQTLMRFWLPNLGFNQAVIQPQDVPGTGGTLWAIDIRSYRWNEASWLTVAQREPYCVIPASAGPHVDLLRLNAGIFDPKVLSFGSLIRADWLFRETIETNRSPSYYDLLYSDQRFKFQRVLEKVSYEHLGGRLPSPHAETCYDAEPGIYTIAFFTPKIDKIVNFPANAGDFELAFGVKEISDFLKKQKLFADSGAIIAGHVEDPVRGSMVSRNGRVIKILQTPFGWFSETYDLLDTSKEDFFEKPEEIPFENFQFDASELLATLPNGGMAGILVAGKEQKRIEIATTDLVHMGLVKDPKRGVDVRNVGACFECHGPDYGFIPLDDQFQRALKAGVKRNIYDKDKYDRLIGFFGLDDLGGWSEKLDMYQRPMKSLLRKTTGLGGAKPWTGAEMTKAFNEFRNQYDDPLALDQVCRELGVTEDRFKTVVAKASPSGRLNWLVVGNQPIARRVWEARQYEIALRLMRLP
ncbi:MAG: hypothetical protein E6R03_15905 [Hyphomicrobiaceae bacterium]|nr:MAG: hypothetical protein E6R03_15905 [Hyphomicrobiaceae bacterium]